MSSSGRSDWHNKLEDIVFAYNSSGHSTIGGLEPAVALHKSLQGDNETIQYVRTKNFIAAKRRMGVEGSLLEVGQKVRVSIYAISSAARKMKKGMSKARKPSQVENYTRSVFTIKHVSKGTALQHRQCRLRELRGIFWRTELLPVSDELRKDAAKKRASKDPTRD